MSSEKLQPVTSRNVRPVRHLAEVVETVQWLLIALILALFFRAFIMEAYRIPTGSMATTLKGAHFQLCCPRCGYRFDRGFDSSEYDLPQDSLPADGRAVPFACFCPVCGYELDFDEPMWVAHGDRILVLKCQYQFVEPKRWDVIVFKNPLAPAGNMIKRLIALPGENVRIAAGDIYIDGKIARKPPKLQRDLWMCIYDSDYRPVSDADKSFGDNSWRPPWRNLQQSPWKIDPDNYTRFELDCPGEQLYELVFDDSDGNRLKVGSVYNGEDFYGDRPYCTDIKVRFFARADGAFHAGAELKENGKTYRAMVDGALMFIDEIYNGGKRRLAERNLAADTDNGEMIVFTNVDHRLTFQCGNESITCDLNIPFDELTEEANEPVIKILAAGKVEVSHLAIFRDIYYTGRHFYVNADPARAAGPNGFTLGDDEYFVLGDNSTNSYDGRWWSESATGNNGRTYRQGIVPRNYLVGKAVYVYWPSGFRPFIEFAPAVVPNIGQMRFIYGGSNKSP